MTKLNICDVYLSLLHPFPLFGSFTTELMCGPFSEIITRSFKVLFDIEVLNLLKMNYILSRNPLSQGTLEICIKIANFSSMTRFGMFLILISEIWLSTWRQRRVAEVPNYWPLILAIPWHTICSVNAKTLFKFAKDEIQFIHDWGQQQEQDMFGRSLLRHDLSLTILLNEPRHIWVQQCLYFT